MFVRYTLVTHKKKKKMGIDLLLFYEHANEYGGKWRESDWGAVTRRQKDRKNGKGAKKKKKGYDVDGERKAIV